MTTSKKEIPTVYVAICRCGNAYIIRRTNRSQTLNSTQYSKHPAAPPVLGEACRARRASLTNSKRFPRCIVVTTKKMYKKKYTTQSLTEY